MSRAIPLRLLVHDCILKKTTGIDRNRNPIYSEIVLKHEEVMEKLRLTP